MVRGVSGMMNTMKLFEKLNLLGIERHSNNARSSLRCCRGWASRGFPGKRDDAQS